jgi:hypothetical protein
VNSAGPASPRGGRGALAGIFSFKPAGARVAAARKKLRPALRFCTSLMRVRVDRPGGLITRPGAGGTFPLDSFANLACRKGVRTSAMEPVSVQLDLRFVLPHCTE